MAKHTKNPSCWVSNRVVGSSSPARDAPRMRHPATRNESPDVLLSVGLVFVAKSSSLIRTIVCSIFTHHWRLRIVDGRIDGHPSWKRVNQISAHTADNFSRKLQKMMKTLSALMTIFE